MLLWVPLVSLLWVHGEAVRIGSRLRRLIEPNNYAEEYGARKRNIWTHLHRDLHFYQPPKREKSPSATARNNGRQHNPWFGYRRNPGFLQGTRRVTGVSESKMNQRQLTPPSGINSMRPIDFNNPGSIDFSPRGVAEAYEQVMGSSMTHNRQNLMGMGKLITDESEEYDMTQKPADAANALAAILGDDAGSKNEAIDAFADALGENEAVNEDAHHSGANGNRDAPDTDGDAYKSVQHNDGVHDKAVYDTYDTVDDRDANKAADYGVVDEPFHGVYHIDDVYDTSEHTDTEHSLISDPAEDPKDDPTGDHEKTMSDLNKDNDPDSKLVKLGHGTDTDDIEDQRKHHQNPPTSRQVLYTVMEKPPDYEENMMWIHHLSIVGWLMFLFSYIIFVGCGLVATYRNVEHERALTSNMFYYSISAIGQTQQCNYQNSVTEFVRSFHHSPTSPAMVVSIFRATSGESLYDVVNWRGKKYAKVFHFSLDISQWISALPVSQEGNKSITEFLRDKSSIASCQIQKTVEWAEWEELACNVKRALRERGYPIVRVDLNDKSTTTVNKNTTIKQFLRSVSGRAFLALSIIGAIGTTIYEYFQGRVHVVPMKFRVDVNKEVFWNLIHDRFNEPGFLHHRYAGFL